MLCVVIEWLVCQSTNTFLLDNTVIFIRSNLSTFTLLKMSFQAWARSLPTEALLGHETQKLMKYGGCQWLYLLSHASFSFFKFAVCSAMSDLLIYFWHINRTSPFRILQRRWWCDCVSSYLEATRIELERLKGKTILIGPANCRSVAVPIKPQWSQRGKNDFNFFIIYIYNSCFRCHDLSNKFEHILTVSLVSVVLLTSV